MTSEFAAHLTRVRHLSRDFEVDLAAAALRFSMRTPLVDSTVVRISSLRRLEALTGLLAATISDEFFAAVEALGPPPPNGND